MIGILNAYHFDPTPGNYQETYTSLIGDFVKSVFPGEETRIYEVAFGQWPRSPKDCDFWIVTGSPKSAYDKDPWILKLKDFVLALHQQKKKLVGICFGHQIIAEALGGKVEKSPKGWGVGVKSFAVVEPRPWMIPPQENLALIFSHQDQVTRLPGEARLLAQDDFCPIQMAQIGDHIFTLQGHPEFSVEFAKDRLDSRRELIPPDTYDTAMASFARPRDTEIVREWIRRFRSCQS